MSHNDENAGPHLPVTEIELLPVGSAAERGLSATLSEELLEAAATTAVGALETVEIQTLPGKVLAPAAASPEVDDAEEPLSPRASGKHFSFDGVAPSASPTAKDDAVEARDAAAGLGAAQTDSREESVPMDEAAAEVFVTPENNWRDLEEAKDFPAVVVEVKPQPQAEPNPPLAPVEAAQEGLTFDFSSWYCCAMETLRDNVRQLECMRSEDSGSIDTAENDEIYSRLERQRQVEAGMLIGDLPTVPEEVDGCFSDNSLEFPLPLAEMRQLAASHAPQEEKKEDDMLVVPEETESYITAEAHNEEATTAVEADGAADLLTPAVFVMEPSDPEIATAAPGSDAANKAVAVEQEEVVSLEGNLSSVLKRQDDLVQFESATQDEIGEDDAQEKLSIEEDVLNDNKVEKEEQRIEEMVNEEVNEEVQGAKKIENEEELADAEDTPVENEDTVATEEKFEPTKEDIEEVADELEQRNEAAASDLEDETSMHTAPEEDAASHPNAEESPAHGKEPSETGVEVALNGSPTGLGPGTVQPVARAFSHDDLPLAPSDELSHTL